MYRERERVKQDMKKLKLINSSDDLIKAYSDQFKGIGKLPGTYHVYIYMSHFSYSYKTE